MHRAEALRKNDDHRASIEACDAILATHPDQQHALLCRAEALRMLARFPEAIGGFDRVLALDAENWAARCGKAAVLNALGRFAEALPLWESAQRQSPGSFVERGLEACRAGLPTDAAEVVIPPRTRRTVLRRGKPEEVEAPPEPEQEPISASSERSEQPRAPDAIEGQQVPGRRPDRQRARDDLDRGRSFYKERTYAAAVAWFERALQADPTFAEAALRLGMALEDDRQYRRAIEAYQRCLSVDPKQYQAACNIGEAYRKHEKYEEAIKAYDHTLSLQADYLYALAGRAECMRMLGDYEGSLVWFDKALAVGPRHAFGIQGKAAALNSLGRWIEGLPLWNAALEIDPQSPFAREGKAQAEAHASPRPAEKPAESATPLLDEQGRDLTALARAGKLPPVIGREIEVRAVLKTLVRRLKANPLLLGEPGVGKTAVVEAVARRIAADDAPARLRGKRLVELSIGSLVAGTKYRGTFEERLKEIVKEAREIPGIIIFIDEIHTLVGAGRTEGGALDAANMLKPALARGEITVIGATTHGEFRKHFENDPALERRFQPIDIAEPSAADTVALLEAVAERYEVHHGVTVTPEAIRACVELSIRFVPDRRLPDKALDLLDEACSEASLSDRGLVTDRVVAEVVSEKTRVPIADLTSAERERLAGLERSLRANVVGQEQAIGELAAAVRLARSGLRDRSRPRGVFLFAGSSGVGKTELARGLADFLFPEGNALIKLDMSEYSEKFTGSRLIGAPPGYAGHGEEGQLTGPLRKRPYAVVLLDEFEKAHPDVQAMFLSLFDEGRITDSEGRKIQAKDAFFIVTTNAGSEDTRKSRLGFSGDNLEARKAEALEKVRRSFRPELVNRIDSVVVFNDLTPPVLRQVVELHLQRLRKRAADLRVDLSWEPAVVEICTAGPNDPTLGARPSLRSIDDRVAGPLGRWLIEHAESGSGWREVRAVVRNGELQLETGAVRPGQVRGAHKEPTHS
ncbi:MAG: AAA family ATPase [Deltaproteobacteria bacterium]|nr:AAA family ATPase [Deltaproteobacteria bacterium]